MMPHVQVVFIVRGERLSTHNTNVAACFALCLIVGGAVLADVVVSLEVLFELELVLDVLLAVNANYSPSR
jgi:hypothetical protein